MIEKFPYGKAPFWLVVLAVSSTLLLAITRQRKAAEKPDLIFATFAPPHLASYQKALPAFERLHKVKVSLQLVTLRALETRLQNAMLSGTEVPDMVEIVEGGLGFFTKGPIKDVGFVDLTERVAKENLKEREVESRYSLWSSRGHVFAMPHDVHPVMLIYRADIVESLGIDVSKIETWDDFAAAGRKVTRDHDGDGVVDRYMIDFPAGGGFGLTILLLQRGVGMFDERGHVAFNSALTADTIAWYIHQYYGPERIAYEAGWGQSLLKALSDGLVLFMFAPDWRSFTTQDEVPNLKGKMKLMPLPAWEKGGRRTSTWGGTGLAITKACQHPDLAWELAKFFYLQPGELGHRFANTNIIPPLRGAWDLPEFKRPNPYFSGQPLGSMYAALAPDVPPVWSTPYKRVAESKLGEAFLRSVDHYKQKGEKDLLPYIQSELAEAEAYVQGLMDRNVLAAQD
jgi:arabinosaccharide transport system substrate-binding protein